MLSLPTHLTLDHILQKQRKVKPHIQKSYLKQSIQQQEINEIQSILKMTISQDQQQFYDSQFVRIFLLIKLNALLSKQCKINQQFINAFITLYNSSRTLSIRLSKSDDEFFAQVMLEGQLFKFIEIENVHNILGGQCLLATSLPIIIKQTYNFLKKAQITFALGFLALSGRPQAFIPLVHKQKNHEGQIKFASTIQHYIKIDQSEKYLNIQVDRRRVQDPYSMRCSPQVYGVVYECLEFLRKDLDCILNKMHFRTICIDGQEFQNIDFSADTQVLKGDFLVCSLNQIGSMAFLRSERILNIYLGKNQVHKQNPKRVFELKTILEKTIHLTADNKILSAPSNGDTMNIHNYEKDIFFTPYKVYEKFTKMMSNLYKVMQLEIETAILGLNNVYQIKQGEVFLNTTLKDNFFNLQRNCIGVNRKQALFFIKNNWYVSNENLNHY